MEIREKIAIVTGGASGIGRATALALARAGASVVVADIDPDGGDETVSEIRSMGAVAEFVRTDVADVGSMRHLFEATAAGLGGVDIVHNNAGMVAGEPTWPETPPERLALGVSVNLGGPIVGTRLAIDHLARRGGGVIVNTASIAAEVPLADDPMYSATKAGVVMFTRSCASLSVTHGIRVNAVLPAMVDTPMINKTGDGSRPAAWLAPMLEVSELLRPDDVAAVVMDLVRDDGAVGETRMVVTGS